MIYYVVKYILSKDFENAIFDFVSCYGSLRNFAIKAGYSASYVSAVLNGRKPLNDKFLNTIKSMGFTYDL